MLTALFQMIINGIGSMGRFMALLPSSPFQNLENVIGENPAINAVLWVVPVSQALALLQLWVTAIAMYYLAKVPLRWIKIIKS